MAGKEVEHLHIKTTLDTKDLDKQVIQVEKKLDKVKKKIEKEDIKMDISVEDSKLKSGVKEAEKELGKLEDKEVKIEVDASGVSGEAMDVVKMLDKIKDKTVEIDGDADLARQEVLSFVRELGKLKDKSVQVDADAGTAQQNVDRLNGDLHGLPSNVDVQVNADTAKAQNDVKELSDDLKELKKDADGISLDGLVSGIGGGFALNGMLQGNSNMQEGLNTLETSTGTNIFNNSAKKLAGTGQTGDFMETSKLVADLQAANPDIGVEGIEKYAVAYSKLEKAGLGDVKEISKAVTALKNNFDLSDSQALKWLFDAQSSGLNFANDLTDTVSEYAIQYKAMGLNSAQMMKSLDVGRKYSWNTDKPADLFKEFRILTSEELSKDQQKQMAKLGSVNMGLDYNQVLTGMEYSEKVAKGGDKALKQLYKTFGQSEVEAALKEYSKSQEYEERIFEGIKKGGKAAVDARLQLANDYEKLPDEISKQMVGVAFMGTMNEDMANKGGKVFQETMKVKEDTYKNNINADKDVEKAIDKTKTFNEMMTGFGNEMAIVLDPLMKDIIYIAENTLPMIVDFTKTVVGWQQKLPDGVRPWATALAGVLVTAGGIYGTLKAISGVKNAVVGGMASALGFDVPDKKKKGKRTKSTTSKSVIAPMDLPDKKKVDVDTPSTLSRVEKNASKTSSLGKLAKIGKAGGAVGAVVALGLGINELLKSDDKQKSAFKLGGNITGGLAGAWGGAKAGAAAGTLVAPGLGTAVGGVIGGIGGGIAGSFAGEWIGEKASGAWDYIKEGASDASRFVSESFGTITEGLSNSLFSGDWWGEKWNGVKSITESSVFDAGWWAEKAGFAYGVIESTLLNGDLWAEKWQGVKDITSEAWNGITSMFGYVMEGISSTVFNGDWWSEKWNQTKTIASDVWSGAVDIWNGVKDGVASTIFNGDWWSEKWNSTKQVASTVWSGATDIWTGVMDGISSTLFNASWWSSKWEGVKSGAISALGGISDWLGSKLSGMKEWASNTFGSITSGFQSGRKQGQDTVRVGQFAKGGVFTKDSIVNLAENGMEAVVPLQGGYMNPFADAIAGRINSISTGAMSNAGKAVQTVQVEMVPVQLNMDGHLMAETLLKPSQRAQNMSNFEQNRAFGFN